MLLDSTTSLKMVHDALGDFLEFLGIDPRTGISNMSKWRQLLASPEDPDLPEDSAVPDGYVEFNYSDGHAIQIPCLWKVTYLSDGSNRERITLRNGQDAAVWECRKFNTAYGEITALFLERLAEIGVLSANRLIAHNSVEYGHVLTLVAPGIFNMIAANVDASGLSVEKIKVSGIASVESCSFAELDLADGDAAISSAQIEDAVAGTFTCDSPRLQFAEKFNAWTSKAVSTETDAAYSGYIPFDALSSDGRPINGFGLPIAANPFYPDFVYAINYPSTWKPPFAWVPSSKPPTGTYWRDSDGIYWHRTRVTTTESRFGNVNAIWPPHSMISGDFDTETLPPFRFAADGMIVTVQNLSATQILVAATDRYTRGQDGNWTWAPGNVSRLSGERMCQFMARRNFIWSGDEIAAVEYQFLPIGYPND